MQGYVRGAGHIGREGGTEAHLFLLAQQERYDSASDNLQATLMEAGKMRKKPGVGLRAKVFSPDSLVVQGYTRFGNETLLPVSEY